MLEGKELEELKRKYAGELSLTPEEHARVLAWHLKMLGDPTPESLAELAEFDAKRAKEKAAQPARGE